MCAQPPHKSLDHDSANLVFEAIRLVDINTPQITFTGGEPTLLGRTLVDLIGKAKCFLPRTALMILTNGRLLRYLSFAKDIADVRHPDLRLGIPIYSDYSHEHDFIVQDKGAFDETAKGILNSARYGLNVEIRIVITEHNYKALPSLAEFIARNFPFCCNVALMGLEPIGFAKTNIREVWIDPVLYAAYLELAVQALQEHRLPTSIYNHQLCTLSPSLWRFAKQSISDWKNIYLDKCVQCSVRHQCCGFFASGQEIHSTAINPLTVDLLN